MLPIYVIVVPLKTIDIPSIGEVLIHHIVCIPSPSQNLTGNKDRTMTKQII